LKKKSLVIGQRIWVLFGLVRCNDRFYEFLKRSEFFLVNENKLMSEEDEVFEASVEMSFLFETNYFLEMRVVYVCVNSE
jgi:hypothetical protein